MLDSVVTIDVVPGDTPAEYAPAMVAACSQALTQGRCELANATPESAEVEAVAIVLWQGNQSLQATVRVGRHGSQWLARNLTFAERDPIEDRWTTIGLTVATLVGEGKAPAPEAPLPKPEPRPQGSGTHKPVSRLEISGALGAELGSSWQDGQLERGVWGSLEGSLRDLPLVAQGFVSYGISGGPELSGRGELRSSWFSAGVGLGARGVLRPLDLRGTLLVDVLFRHVGVELDGVKGSDEDVPVKLRALGAWPARSAIAAVFGGALRVPFNEAQPSDAHHVRQPTLSFDLLAGVEVRL